MDIRKLFSFLYKKAETANSKTITDRFFPTFYSGFTNTSGENISAGSALSISTVWACVNVISQDIAKVPFYCYQKTDQGKERQSNSLSFLLNYKPNEFTTAIDFRQAMTANVLLYGNAYAEILRDIYGVPTGLYIIAPHRVSIVRDKTKMYYEVTVDSYRYKIDAENMFHIKGMGGDGYSGFSVINYAAQSMGTALASDKFAGSFFGNGSTMGGFLEHPQNLSATAAKNLKDSIEASHRGVDQAHRLLLLEEGMKYTQGGINNKDSQFLESRQFNVSEICRWFRIQPHKVADLSRATFSNIEQQSIDYVNDTLSVWYRKWELESWSKLLSAEEKEQGFYVEHVLEALLKGDIQTRYSAYATARQWGWLSINDIRERENMNKVEGGDSYLMPLNMQDINQKNIITPEQKAELSLFKKSIAERLGNTELKELDKQLSRADFDDGKFSEWMEKFYSKHFAYIKNSLSILGKEIKAEEFCLYSQLKEAEDKRGVFNSIKETYIVTLQEKINELFK